jgi:hypothetical protein
MTLITQTSAPVIRTEGEAIKDIFEMHRYCRPMGSKADEKFREEYLKPLGVEEDGKGNLIKYIGESRVLWSSHTDTVHSISGFQRIMVEKGMMLSLHRESSSNCLGADCTAGVFIMREMIMAQVPGLYIFHYGEERGGIGSSFIKSKTPELLKDIDYAIAFDRYGTTSIITHQGGQRCCSDKFVKSLNKALGGGYKGDSGGSFTDTANYTGLVAECTNISVGYKSQHSRSETQDIRYLLDLRKKMLAFDESKLVKDRKPGAVERLSYGGSRWWEDDASWYSAKPRQPLLPIDGQGTFSRRSYSDFARLLRDNAAAVADWLESEGIDYEEVEQAIYDLQGFVRGGNR